MPMLKDGRLAPIAVGGSRRAAALPEIPTTLEAGYANSDYSFWVGLFAPSRTPREIVQRLHQETSSALRTPEVAQRLARLGAEPMPMTPEQFDAHLREEVVINSQLVKAAGLKPN
jgi:tripartite-type tricarboxylate transporter receptor subunit TctC